MKNTRSCFARSGALTFLALVALLTGCPDASLVQQPALDADDQDGQCEHGQERACVCNDDRAGVQSCSPDGEWTACDCSDSPHQPDLQEDPREDLLADTQPSPDATPDHSPVDTGPTEDATPDLVDDSTPQDDQGVEPDSEDGTLSLGEVCSEHRHCRSNNCRPTPLGAHHCTPAGMICADGVGGGLLQGEGLCLEHEAHVCGHGGAFSVEDCSLLSCGSNLGTCQGGGCLCSDSCGEHSDCAETAFCLVDTCTPRRADGQICTEDSQCLNANCRRTPQGNNHCAPSWALCADGAGGGLASDDGVCLENDAHVCNSLGNFVVDQCDELDCGLDMGHCLDGSCECSVRCENDESCGPNAFCLNNACTPKRADGQICTEARQCLSDNCRNTPQGQLHCAPVGALCANGEGGGLLLNQGVCIDGSAHVCNQFGNFVIDDCDALDCGFYLGFCSGGNCICYILCDEDDDCAAHAFCSIDSSCIAKQSNGQTCTSDRQCQSNNCRLASDGGRYCTPVGSQCSDGVGGGLAAGTVVCEADTAVYCEAVDVLSVENCQAGCPNGTGWCEFGYCFCPSAPEGYSRIEPGSFTMGSPTDESVRYSNENQTPVVITRAFFMQTTPVTQQQYLDVRGTNPANNQAGGRSCPVEMVSWNNALRYLDQLSTSMGLTPCYSDVSASDRPTENPLDCEGFRLATEAEWEYAARAGNTGTHDPNQPLDEVAWYDGNTTTTRPVQGKALNAWGLYDMYGNIWEWVWDAVGNSADEQSLDYSYPDAPVTDPMGRSGLDSFQLGHRGIRGGSFRSPADRVRAAARGRGWIEGVYFNNVGFRSARTVPRQPPGGRCTCDSDCLHTGSQDQDPVCILGVCMALSSTGTCSSAGSTLGCPTGMRCWGGLCYPDYHVSTCVGEEDSDGSCVPTFAMNCDEQCGFWCE